MNGATGNELRTPGSMSGSRPLRVSVVMPSFNHGRFIGAAIDSVLAQDYPQIELLVIDGGSTDGTIDILRGYGNRLTFVSQKDRGQSDAINRGLRQSRGDVLCWLNSDDLFTPGAVRRVVETFAKHPEAQFVYGKGWTIDEFGTVRGDSGVLPLDAWKLIHQRNFIQQPSCFFRRSLFERVGPVDEALHYVMDWDLWIRFTAFPGIYVEDYLSSNREYGQNKTQSGQFRRWREIKTMVRRYTERRWPPVVWFYLMEAIIQASRTTRWLRWIEFPLSRLFMLGMIAEMSGRYPDGQVRRRFHVSIGNPDGHRQARLRIAPLATGLGTAEVSLPALVHWRSASGERGTARRQAGARELLCEVPLDRDRLFTHLTVVVVTADVPLPSSVPLRPNRAVAVLAGTDTAA